MEATTARIPFLSALSEHGQELLGLLDAEASVDSIVSNAEQHRVDGFLFRDIRGWADSRREEVYRGLHKKMLSRATFALMNRAVLVNLLGRCEELGIPVIVIKGVALNEYVYMDNICRGMLDMDFMVPKDAVADIMEIMSAMGMVPCGVNDSRWVNTNVRHIHHIRWRWPTGPARCDLECHWHVVPPYSPFPLDVSYLWESSIEKTLDGLPVRVLSPEFALIFACIHWHRHNYRLRLVDLFDIYALACHDGELDMAALVQYAVRWNADGVLFHALTQVCRFFRVDSRHQAEIRKLQPRRLLQHVLISLLSRGSVVPREGNGKRPGIENLVLALSGFQIRLLLRWIIPSRGKVAHLYNVAPESVSVFHYRRYVRDAFVSAFLQRRKQ